MDTFECSYCAKGFAEYSSIIEHCLHDHRYDILKIKTVKRVSSAKTVVQTKNFGIVPEDINLQGKYIVPCNKNFSVRIQRLDQPLCSPYRKLPKVSSTPLKSKAELDFLSSDDEDEEENLSTYFEDLSLLEDSHKDTCTQTDDFSFLEEDAALYKQIVDMIPSVIETLKEHNMTDMYLKFNSLLSSKQFPIRNIAFLLFADVVEWFSQDNTHMMPYSEEVKQFWKIGLKLFKGKFLRFMGGWKNQGQNTKGHTCPKDSMINFAVPERSRLDTTGLSEKLKNMKPGIFTEMIEIASNDDPQQTKTFKLCVDGKKINIGATNQDHGDVNLWGYESSPTLSQRKKILNEDGELLETFSNLLNSYELRDIETIFALMPHQKNELVSKGQSILKTFSKRLRALRKAKQSKVMSLTKLQTVCSTDEMKAKYSFALSAMKTYIYRINMTINRLLHAFDILGDAIAKCNEVGQLYKTGTTCDLSIQQNYFCLTGPSKVLCTDPESVDSSVVKQRSDLWKDVRKLAKVTGSTAQQALGLSSLKKMNEHIQYAFNDAEKPEPDEEGKKRMQYGSDNEINAVGTLVSKILPVFFPTLAYVEEGCEIVPFNEKPLLVVSPDGSTRNLDSMKCKQTEVASNGIEIKCPYPGKTFTTPVYYMLPWYYVVQVLSEMFTLRTDSLIFLCYSEESTTVLLAKFDTELFQDVLTLLQTLYGGKDAWTQKRLPEGIHALKDRLKLYCETNVEFVVEMPSLKLVKLCGHENTTDKPSNIGLKSHSRESFYDKFDEKCTISSLQTLCLEFRELLNESYGLERHLASEVLVFLISDLDRIHEREKQYAIPIGYGLKGYSLSSSVFRQMIDDVLHACYIRGLYTPVISYDGQWASLVVRSKEGYPLTQLQLQKDVFKESKKMSKCEILKFIKQTNVVECSTLEDCSQQITGCFHVNDSGYFQGAIQFQRAASCSRIFSTSYAVREFLNKASKCGTSPESDDDKDHDTNMFLDDLPPVVINSLDDDLISNIRSDTRSSGSMFQSEIDDLPEVLGRLFFAEISNGAEEKMEVPNSGAAESIEMKDDSCTATKKNESEITFLTTENIDVMLESLRHDTAIKSAKWKDVTIETFKTKIENADMIRKSFTRYELQTCFRSIIDKLKSEKVNFAISWTKEKLVKLMENLNNTSADAVIRKNAKHGKRKLFTLKKLCAMAVNKFPKAILNIIIAEYKFPTRLQEWYDHSPFSSITKIAGICEEITWFSQPEYVPETFTYQFHLLDCHHLFVNARVKCCSTGIKECGLKRDAWVRVAKDNANNKSGLSLALVDDLVDKQSNAFARKTFSSEVEEVMYKNGDLKEATFCRLIREWYESEDEPGICAIERIRRRLAFRHWILRNVDFGKFPPYGTHINGIPHIMFEGILTNIDRRIQLIPFVKSGKYNARALGSLEVENFFGAFQDLDPKGSGIIRPDDIPSAIGTACELIWTRMNPDRVFHMHTSRAKVYPMHDLSDSPSVSSTDAYMTPLSVTEIVPRDHMFDSALRASRKCGKRKRGEISRPLLPSKGARPVREHHKCDEAKVLPHIRFGADISDI